MDLRSRSLHCFAFACLLLVTDFAIAANSQSDALKQLSPAEREMAEEFLKGKASKEDVLEKGKLDPVKVVNPRKTKEQALDEKDALEKRDDKKRDFTRDEAKMDREEEEIDEESVELNEERDLLKAYKEFSGEKLERFGQNLFAGAPTSFTPVTEIPIPSNYVLGPGDELIIQTIGKESDRFTVTVDRTGSIFIEEIGHLQLAGESFDSARKQISDLIKSRKIGVEARVSIGELRSIRVFLLGEAFQPGSYEVSALSTITNALFVSGGINDIGSLRNIQLKRNNKVVGTLDLYDLLLKGNTQADKRLMAGDVIFIPSAKKLVEVEGAVVRPAIYELKEERELKDVLALAGGLKPNVDFGHAFLSRANKAGTRDIIDFDLTNPIKIAIENGDRIYIPRGLEKLNSAVSVTGHLHRPLAYAWTPDLKLSDIIPPAAQIKLEADLEYAIIKREISDESKVAIVPVNPTMAKQQPQSSLNMQLQPRDELIILPLNDDRQELLEPIIETLKSQSRFGNPANLVAVTGNVRHEGQYPYYSDMTVADLIRSAGGLNVNAYNIEAELIRESFADPKHFSTARLNLGISGADKQFALKPGDYINIQQIPNWNALEMVTLLGEVKFPGSYPITRGESIKSVLQRAGGLTSDASTESAIFTRESLKEKERAQLKQFRSQIESSLAFRALTDGESTTQENDSKELSDSLLNQIEETEPTGRLVIDLAKLLQDESDLALSLKDGDTLVIPRVSSEVSVIGEVNFPTSHLFDGDKSLGSYVDASGGLTAKADEKRIYVIKANGAVIPSRLNSSGWFNEGESADIRPGDTIVVPYDFDRMPVLKRWAAVSQVMFQLATTAATLKAIGVF